VRIDDLTAARARESFLRFFDTAPDVLIRAPGRVNLIGEFTDFNDGYCLPCAIDRETVVAARRRRDSRVRVIAIDVEGEDHFDVSSPVVPVVKPNWVNYVRGVFAALNGQGQTLAGVDLVITGNIPRGAGLSSSASLEIAVGETLRRLFDLPLTALDLARAGQRAEHEFVGSRCGIMDQVASAFGVRGHALLLDCARLQITPVPIPQNIEVVVIDSGIQRGLVESEYNARREQCELAAQVLGVATLREISGRRIREEASRLDDLLARRARHVITENERTLQAAECLRMGDLRGFGDLIRQSHRSLRDDFQVSLPPIDRLVEIVQSVVGERGGARLTGGGFGGCVVAVVPDDLVVEVKSAVERQYRSPSGEPGVVHVCMATDGAGEVL